MPLHKIPFNRTSLVGTEFQYIRRALDDGHISGDGQFTRRCSEMIASVLGACKVLLTTSCTHALEMAAILLDLKPGDEVIVPSFTFVSTVNAFALRGAVPKFCDIRMDTLNMDERLVESMVSVKTKAIVPVHYAGVGCEMDRLMEIARRRGLAVVEDNAHGLFGRYRGKPLGTFGCLGTQSFHETKNFSCGEGGALIINDPAMVERAEIIREKGTDRSRFFRGQVDKYTWVDIGSSYLPSDILAAFLCAQIEARDAIQAARRGIWERYMIGLKAWANDQGVRMPTVPLHCGQSYHMFYLLLPSLEARQALIAKLRDRGILAVFHYLPLHLSRMGRKFGGTNGQCPVAEDISDRILRLPFYNSLSADDQDEVIECILGFKAA